MKTILSCFAIVLMSFTAMAEEDTADNADLHTAIEAFNLAYATNDVEGYFNFYADDATVYFGQDARVDMAEYYEMWTELMAAGGGVELNTVSDLRVQILSGGAAAVVTSFIDNRTRSPDGTKTTSKAFETDVWQKIDGEWKIVSLHYNEFPADE